MQLRITEEGKEPETLQVSGDEITLGRSRENTVVLSQGYVSGKHCRIYQGMLVTDLGSRNGTFLDQVAIDQPTLIAGRSLTVGGLTLQVEVVHDDELSSIATLAREVRAMRERLDELQPPTGGRPVPVPESAAAKGAAIELLDTLVREDHKSVPMPPAPDVSEVYLYESFKFIRNAETIVSRLAAELTKKLSLQTQLPGSEDNFRTLLAALLVMPDDPAVSKDVATYLDKLLGWLYASVQVYQEAAIALADEICGTLKPNALLRLGPIPTHMRVLGLENLVLWQRAQERLDEMSPNYIIDRLDALARIAANKELET